MALTADQTALLNNTIAGILGANSTNFNTVKSYIIDKVNNGTVSIKDITMRPTSLVREAISKTMAVDPASVIGVKVIDGTTYQGDGSGRYVEVSTGGVTSGNSSSGGSVNSVNGHQGDVIISLNDLGLTALGRADKVLSTYASQFMHYDSDHNITEIRYGTNTQVNYEMYTYDANGNLSTIKHYLDSALKGTTTLTPIGDDLFSAVYVGV